MAKIRKGSPDREENEKKKPDMRTTSAGSDSLNIIDKKTALDKTADNHKQTDLRKEPKERKPFDGRENAHKENKTSVHGPDVLRAERTDNVHRDKNYIEEKNIKKADDTTVDPKKAAKREETTAEKERAHRENQRHVDTAATADQGQAAMAANRMSADYEHVRREAKRKADMTARDRKQEEGERTENRRNVREERGTDNEGVTSSTQGRII